MHTIVIPPSRLTRLIEAYRHPDQAAIAARLPLIRRRVPNRAYWRARGFRLRSASEHVTLNALERTRQARRIARKIPPIRLRGARWPLAAAGALAGILAMFILDPQNGRRRRALLRDRFTHMRRVASRDIPGRVTRRGRFVRGMARGTRHSLSGRMHANGNHMPPPDDETLVARVRSEVLRQGRYLSGEIHLDAYEGCVTLRGQLADEGEIRRLVREVQRVDDVREVRSYLHTPGTLPPNKAESYRADPVPAHMAAEHI